MSIGSKVLTASEAIEKFVKQGSCLSIGGFTISRNPMALVHEIIKQDIGDLHVVMHSGSQALDLLVGTQKVSLIEIAYGANGRLAPTCVRFRKAVESKTLKVEDYSNYQMTLRFMAGAMGVPFLPTLSGLGSDILDRWGFTSKFRESRNSLPDKKIITIQDPFSDNEQPIVLVPAVNPEVTIIHVQKASEEGSIRIEGLSFSDIEQARSSKHVIVSCEQLLSNNELRIESHQNALPHVLVDAVVHQPLGAHPTACYKYYDYDMSHLNEYRSLAMDDMRFREYVETYVMNTDSFDNYLELVGNEHLHSIKASSKEGYARRYVDE